MICIEVDDDDHVVLIINFIIYIAPLLQHYIIITLSTFQRVNQMPPSWARETTRLYSIPEVGASANNCSERYLNTCYD